MANEPSVSRRLIEHLKSSMGDAWERMSEDERQRMVRRARSEFDTLSVERVRGSGTGERARPDFRGPNAAFTPSTAKPGDAGFVPLRDTLRARRPDLGSARPADAPRSSRDSAARPLPERRLATPAPSMPDLLSAPGPDGDDPVRELNDRIAFLASRAEAQNQTIEDLRREIRDALAARRSPVGDGDAQTLGRQAEELVALREQVQQLVRATGRGRSKADDTKSRRAGADVRQPEPADEATAVFEAPSVPAGRVRELESRIQTLTATVESQVQTIAALKGEIDRLKTSHAAEIERVYERGRASRQQEIETLSAETGAHQAQLQAQFELGKQSQQIEAEKLRAKMRQMEADARKETNITEQLHAQQIDGLQAEVDALREAARRQLDEAKRNDEARVEQTQAKIAALEAVTKRQYELGYESRQLEVNKLREDIAALEKEAVKQLEVTQESQKTNIADLKKTIAALQDELEARPQQDEQSRQGEVDGLNAEIEKLKEQAEELEAEGDEQREEIDQLQSRVDVLEEEVAERTLAQHADDKELERLRAEVRELAAELAKQYEPGAPLRQEETDRPEAAATDAAADERESSDAAESEG